ncbi:MAG: hypothetical protein IJ637_08560 [Prevotella sp.]|nr:hypothetical protein [Prevotella sp.]
MQNDFELENMRQQLNTLKKKLEHQEIVSDRMIRQSMKKNVVDINRTYLWLSVLCVLMIPYGYWAFVVLGGFSIAFWIGTCVFMLICFGYTFWNGKDMRSSRLLQADLLEARRKIALAKKRDSQWLLYGIPLLLLWLAWFVCEVRQKGSSEEATGFFWGGCVGGIIGAVAGLKIHFKTQRQYQEIIDQIEDFAA